MVTSAARRVKAAWERRQARARQRDAKLAGLMGSEAARAALPSNEPQPWWRRAGQFVDTVASLLLEAKKTLEYEPKEISANYAQLASDWAKIGGENNRLPLTSIEGIGPARASILTNFGYETLADLATADPDKIREVLGQNISTVENWIAQAKIALSKDEEALGKAKGVLDRGKGDISDRLPEADELYLGPNVGSKWWQAADAAEGVGRWADLGALVGNVAAVAGAKWGETVAKASDALGIVSGAGQVAKNAPTAWRIIRTGKLAKNLGPVTALGKFAGGVSVVTGAITMVDGWLTIAESMQDGKADVETFVGALDTLSGLASVVGGVALFIPGAQPIAATAFGLSAVFSGAATVVENWSAIKSGVSSAWDWITGKGG